MNQSEEAPNPEDAERHEVQEQIARCIGRIALTGVQVKIESES